MSEPPAYRHHQLSRALAALDCDPMRQDLAARSEEFAWSMLKLYGDASNKGKAGIRALFEQGFPVSVRKILADKRREAGLK